MADDSREAEPDLRLDLNDFPVYEIALFDEAKTDRFIAAWYAELARIGSMPAVSSPTGPRAQSANGTADHQAYNDRQSRIYKCISTQCTYGKAFHQRCQVSFVTNLEIYLVKHGKRPLPNHRQSHFLSTVIVENSRNPVFDVNLCQVFRSVPVN